MAPSSLQQLEAHDAFVSPPHRAVAAEVQHMLSTLGLASLDALIDRAIPATIRQRTPLALPAALSEVEALAALRAKADRNAVLTSLIGCGYHDTITPGVILRNILESPAWYTAYTPYQPEISQGRLEALLNFQTMCTDLAGMDIANASLLDEATAAAEAMAMLHRVHKKPPSTFVVDPRCHPQTIDVVRVRAEPLGIDVVVADPSTHPLEGVYGVLVQYPGTDGTVEPLEPDRAARATKPARWSPSPRTYWPSCCCSRRARRVPTASSGRRNASACPWASGARTRRSWRRATRSSARCRADSSASRSTPRDAPRIDWRCRRANSTSAARRRRPTSAPHRCCCR